MPHRIENIIQRIRRRLSRSEWAIRLLRLSTSTDPPEAPGLLLVQIDGLSRPQFLHALRKGRMPFLHSRLNREGYRLHRFYPGQPATTPAIQGEIMYGRRAVVPAFSFFDKERGRTVKMMEKTEAARIQAKLESESGEPLLRGGSVYSSIYSGGAAEPHFCISTLGIGDILGRANPLATLLLMLANLYSWIRTGAFVVLEFFVALGDFFRGLTEGRDLWKELKFIPTRVGICVLMRERIVISAKIDLARGLPIVFVNFLGYDEQAHRRGPGSHFAHWALKGIDDAIARLWRAASRSERRIYDLWVFSDHGQEETLPYPRLTGKTVHRAVAEALQSESVYDDGTDHEKSGIQHQRIRLLRQSAQHRKPNHGPPRAGVGRQLVVAAMGPLGYVYLPDRLNEEGEDRLARRMVEQARIPLVLAPGLPGEARAWTSRGQFLLPRDATEVLGEDHPYREEAAQDLAALTHHPDAGDFTISGWRPDDKPIAFPIENGSHAGPGRTETDAFLLATPDAPLKTTRRWVGPTDLRHAVLEHLGRARDRESNIPAYTYERHKRSKGGLLRVLTYNVHICRGMDGRLVPERIARVIAQYDPDIVALQELDVGRSRTGGVHQASIIAEFLRMQFHFHPAIEVESEQYGDAILSRYPMRLVKAGALPRPVRPRSVEPRGAVCVAVKVRGREILVANTHLGLGRREQIRQAEALAGPDWLNLPSPSHPLILCGDMNAFPRSPVCRLFGRYLLDAQRTENKRRPQSTWFGRLPILRIDHVFVDPRLEVKDVFVPSTDLTRVASDHLPLVVDIALNAIYQ